MWSCLAVCLTFGAVARAAPSDVAREPVLVLPAGADPAIWRAAAAITGFVVGEDGDPPRVRLERGPAGWVVVAVDASGAERRTVVPAPVSAQDREDVLWVAASLVHAVPLRVPAPAPAQPMPAPRHAPVPAPVAIAEPPQETVPERPQPPPVVPARPPPSVEPVDTNAVDSVDSVNSVDTVVDAPARRRPVALSLSGGLGLVAGEPGGDVGLELAVPRGVAFGGSVRYQPARAAVDVGVGVSWRSPARWSPFARFALGGSGRRLTLPDGTDVRTRTPVVELDLGGAVRVASRFDLRPMALVTLDAGGSMVSTTVHAGDAPPGTPAPTPTPTPVATATVDRPWRLGAGLVVAYRFW